MSTRHIFHMGNEMTEDWPTKVQASQRLTHYTIEGQRFPRLRFGDERPRWGAEHRSCPDCGVVRGMLHVPGCDVEACPGCGSQAIGCGCDRLEGEADVERMAALEAVGADGIAEDPTDGAGDARDLPDGSPADVDDPGWDPDAPPAPEPKAE